MLRILKQMSTGCDFQSVAVERAEAPSRFVSRLATTKAVSLSAIIVAIIAIASFYFCLLRYAYNFPYFDDFEVILAFLNSYLTTGQASEKIRLLFEQHAEHRVVFARAVALTEYWLSGKIDFRVLILVGNAALLGVLILFYQAVPRTARLAPVFLAPIAALLFNFRYLQTSFWAMAALQNLWVLCFAFASFYFLFQRPFYTAFIASFLGWLATYTSGNGAAAFVAGAIVLALNRQLWTTKSLIWNLGGLTAIVSYFHGYVKPAQHPGVIDPLTNHPIGYLGYVLALLGSVFTENVVAAVVIGGCLVGFVAYLTFRKYSRDNPIIYTLMVFLLLTSLLGGAARFGFGIEQALVSRYAIISTLFVICCYVALVSPLQKRIGTGWGIVILIVTVCFHYSTYAKYLPEKRKEKTDFERNYAKVIEGKLSHFSFGWPPLDIRRQFPRQELRKADALGYFAFKFREEAEILTALPDNPTRETAHRFERFQQIGPAIVVFSGWGLIRGVPSQDTIPVLCFKDQQGHATNYIVLEQENRADIATTYAADSVDYSTSGFQTIFNRAEIKPGKYTVAVILAAPDFKVTIDAGPTRLGQ